MYLVLMHIFSIQKEVPCIVTETEDKAKEWIEKETKGKAYEGGTFRIRKIHLYK